MITITTQNGNQYSAKTYAKLVKKIAESTWLQQNKIQYMAGVAMRCKLWDGSIIKYRNPKQFIHELHRIGVITDLEES